MDKEIKTTRIIIERDNHTGEIRTQVFARITASFKYTPTDGYERIESVSNEVGVYPLYEKKTVEEFFNDIAKKVDSKEASK